MALGAFHLGELGENSIYGNFHIKEMEMRRRVKQGKQQNIVGLL